MMLNVLRATITRRIFKILAWSIGGVFLLSISLSLLLLIPSVQTYVAGQVTKTLSKMTNAEINVEAVHIAFPKTVRLNGLIIKDSHQDTLLYCQELDINVALLPLFKKKIDVAELNIISFIGNAGRNPGDSIFNFSSILEAFSTKQTKKSGSPSSWDLGFETINLNDINLKYEDHRDSMFLHLELGHLLVDANDTDLLNMYFDFDEIELSEASLNMVLPRDNQKESSTSESKPLPIKLKLETLKVSNIAYDLTIGNENLVLSALVKNATIKPELLDLGAYTIIIDDLTADGINSSLSIAQSDSSVQSNNEPVKTIMNFTFGNFDWNFLVRHADIKNTAYKMDLDKKSRSASGMDYMHMQFNDFNVMADSIFFNKNETGAQVESLSIRERSGPIVKHLSGQFSMNNQNIFAEKIDFKTEKSYTLGQIRLSYPSLNLIGEKIQQLGIDIELSGNVHLDDSRPFTSIIDSFPAFQKIKHFKIHSLKSKGNLGDLALQEADISMKSGTHLELQANIKGLPGTDLNISYALDTFYTSRDDLLEILADTILPENIHLPSAFGISSRGETNLKDGKIDLSLATDVGSAYLNFNLKDELFNLDFQLTDMNIGAILSDTTLGSISLTNHTNGELVNFIPDKFESSTELHSMELNQHIFRNTKIDVGLLDNSYNFLVEVEDSSLTASAKGIFYEADSINHLTANIDFSALELSGLNLFDEYFMATGGINIELHAKSEKELTGNIDISDIRLYRPDNSYFIQNIDFKASMKESSNDFYLQSDILDATLTGNTRLNELDSAIVDHLDHYIQLPEYMISDKDFTFDFNLVMKKSEFFTDFLLNGLQEFKLDKCQLHYNDKDDILTAEIHIPKLQYEGIQLTDLNLDFDTKADSAIADLQLSELNFNSISIDKIGVRSLFEMDHAKMTFYSKDEFDSLKYQLIYNILLKDSLYHISIEPDQLVLNYENWKIAEDNLLVAGDTVFYTNAATISKDDQSVSLGTINKKLSLEFKNFNLANLTEIVVQDSSIEQLSGAIQGSIAFSDVFKNPELIADLKINELAYGGSLLGAIETKLDYRTDQPLSFDFRLNNSSNSLYAKGVLSTAEQQQDFLATIDLNLNDLHVFEPVFSEYLSNMQGAIVGKMALEGNTTDPGINGKFDLKSLDFTINATNTRLNSTGGINIRNNLISFADFTIEDSLQNQLDIRGQIDFSKFSDPLFAMEVSTNDFLVINKKIEQKDVIEGKLNLGLKLKVDGRKSKLKVSNDITINEGTDVAYLMPGNELELITDEGIVEYTDFDRPVLDTIFVQKQRFIGDSIVSLIKGIDFQATLSINPKAKFTVIVDPNSGDFSEFNLTGRLQYLYNDKQRGNLNGLVEFTQGFYELSFYGLVKKRFNFEPGSIVSWSGDVMEGDLNFSARHTVRTNSIGLVSNEISSYERSRYNQRLPYDVILKISDKISSPAIAFGIDLPERYRSAYPTLDSKLSFLNQPNMESERNKQVFALLVGGTFIPEDPSITESSGGSNFATTAAMNSVNSIMTQQLNNLTGQFIEGIDIDMGVNTFDDYGTGQAQTKTQLDVKVSKNLFNDRVTAEMESHINLDGSVKDVGQQSTAGMTEFAVSYKLTETGNYRIKAFRENAYDIFDGEIQNSGIAFIFIKEFDSIRKSKNEGAKNGTDIEQENNIEQQKN